MGKSIKKKYRKKTNKKRNKYAGGGRLKYDTLSIMRGMIMLNPEFSVLNGGKKSKKKTQKKSYKKKYSGGFIDPPPAIQPEFSVKNPTVSSEDSGSPYQRVNDQLQSNNKNQANLNKTLNGQAPKTSGGKKKNNKYKRYT